MTPVVEALAERETASLKEYHVLTAIMHSTLLYILPFIPLTSYAPNPSQTFTRLQTTYPSPHPQRLPNSPQNAPHNLPL